MQAMRLNPSAKDPLLLAADLPLPQPGEGEILVRVHAAGVTPTELLWYPTLHHKDGSPRTQAIPGHEFSGVVAAVGPTPATAPEPAIKPATAASSGAVSFHPGQEIYGLNDWFAEGATAEYCLTQPSSIAPRPASLSHQQAAAVPISALTAIQGLFDRGRLQTGERVLIHGASGAVGLFAVQLARLHGAEVIATASASDAPFLRDLGATQIIDYHATRFEDQVRNVDVVLDAVGGDTLIRSFALLNPGGRSVTIAADAESTTDQRIKDAFFIVEPNQQQLLDTASLIAQGKLRVFVKAVYPLADAATAYSSTATPPGAHGKAVIAVPA